MYTRMNARMHVCMYVCVCVWNACKEVCAFGHAVKTKRKRIRDLVVCLPTKLLNVLYIIAELRLSDSGLVAGTSPVRGTGNVVCIT